MGITGLETVIPIEVPRGIYGCGNRRKFLCWGGTAMGITELE